MTASSHEPDPQDVDAITEVVQNLYYGGWFSGDAGKMRDALHPELVKRGLVDGKIDTDTWQSMVDATEQGIGTRHVPERRHIDVVVDHVHGDIATAHATGDVYVDYLQLVRTDGSWSIVNALWAPA